MLSVTRLEAFWYRTEAKVALWKSQSSVGIHFHSFVYEFVIVCTTPWDADDNKPRVQSAKHFSKSNTHMYTHIFLSFSHLFSSNRIFKYRLFIIKAKIEEKS